MIKDLSKQGLLVDGEQVAEAPVHVGSIITLGTVEILFKGETAVGPAVEGGVLVGEAMPAPEQGALTTTPGGRPGAYLPTENLSSSRRIWRPRRSIASTISLVSFISGLGPLLLGIGWLLGIILGFVSLANIRRRGGLLKDKRMAVWGINLGFAWVVIAFGLLAWRGWVGGVESTIPPGRAERPRGARAIRVTEYYARYGCFSRTNGNGAPEYGSLEALAKVAALLGHARPRARPARLRARDGPRRRRAAFSATPSRESYGRTAHARLRH